MSTATSFRLGGVGGGTTNNAMSFLNTTNHNPYLRHTSNNASNHPIAIASGERGESETTLRSEGAGGGVRRTPSILASMRYGSEAGVAASTADYNAGRRNGNTTTGGASALGTANDTPQHHFAGEPPAMPTQRSSALDDLLGGGGGHMDTSFEVARSSSVGGGHQQPLGQNRALAATGAFEPDLLADVNFSNNKNAATSPTQSAMGGMGYSMRSGPALSSNTNINVGGGGGGGNGNVGGQQQHHHAPAVFVVDGAPQYSSFSGPASPTGVLGGRWAGGDQPASHVPMNPHASAAATSTRLSNTTATGAATAPQVAQQQQVQYSAAATAKVREALQPMSPNEWGGDILINSKAMKLVPPDDVLAGALPVMMGVEGGGGKKGGGSNKNKGGAATSSLADGLKTIHDVRRYFNVKVKHYLSIPTIGAGGANSGPPPLAPSAAVNSAVAMVAGKNEYPPMLVTIPPRQQGSAAIAATQALLFGNTMQNTAHVAVSTFQCGYCGFGASVGGDGGDTTRAGGAATDYVLMLDARYHAEEGPVDHCPMCGMYQLA